MNTASYQNMLVNKNIQLNILTSVHLVVLNEYIFPSCTNMEHTNFITGLTRTHYWSLPSARWMHSIISVLLVWDILPCLLFLGLPRGLFRFSNKTLYTTFFSPVIKYTPLPSHSLDFITPITLYLAKQDNSKGVLSAVLSNRLQYNTNIKITYAIVVK